MCRKRIALSSLVIWLATLFYAVPTFAGHCTASNAYLTYAGDVGTYPSDGIGLTGGQEVRQVWSLKNWRNCDTDNLKLEIFSIKRIYGDYPPSNYISENRAYHSIRVGAGKTEKVYATFKAPMSKGKYQIYFDIIQVDSRGKKIRALKPIKGNRLYSEITVTSVPSVKSDLVVFGIDLSPNKTQYDEGERVKLYATVENRGSGTSKSTTISYKLSTDPSITTRDNTLASESVYALDARRNLRKNEYVYVPSVAGTYWLGACVKVVSSESNTRNNCSQGKQVTVKAKPKPPDLVVFGIDLSPNKTQYDEGERVKLYATVENRGSGTSKSTTISYKLSTDPSITTRDNTLASESVYALDARRNLRKNEYVYVPSVAGTYWLGACVKVVSSESNTRNNCSQGKQVTVKAKPKPPDLVVSNLSLRDNKTRFKTGERFRIYATVKNQGSGNASSTTLEYKLSTDRDIRTSDTTLDTDYVSDLDANRTGNENQSVSAPSRTGTYWVSACVRSVSNESSTSNNCLSPGIQITVEQPRQPDLIVSNLSIRDNKTEHYEGDGFRIEATVKNQGTGTADSTKLYYKLSTNSIIDTNDKQLEDDTVNALYAGSSANESGYVYAPSAGTYWIGACVNAVSNESNTSNNCSPGKQIRVIKRPELHPDMVVTFVKVNQTEIPKGGYFTVDTTVKNQGNANSTSTTAYYKVSSDQTITMSDQTLDTDGMGGQGIGATKSMSESMKAPTSVGRYWVGVCVQQVKKEIATNNNCSTSVEIKVIEPPTPKMVVTPSSQNFGQVEIGKQSSPKTFTISNTGNADLVVQNITPSSNEFKVQGSCIKTITANGSSSGGGKGSSSGSNSCSFSVVFTPSKSTPLNSVLTIRSNDGTKTIRLSGTGIEPPKAIINVNTTALPFGNVEIGQSPSSKSFTISNTGKADLKISAIGKGGDGFSVAHNCGTLKPNGSCQVTVTFKPTQAQHSYKLNITSNASNGTQQVVTLSGNGIKPAEIEVKPNPLTFGDVEIGQSPSKSFNITNTGKADLKISAIGKGGDGFSVAHNCGTLKPNGSCQVTVIFKPTQAQPHSYKLDIKSNASNGTQQVELSGNGKGQAQLSLAPNTAQDFGEIKVDESSSPKTFIIRNNGNVATSIKDIKSTNDGEFKVKDDGCTNTTVSANGGTCTFKIVFEPKKGGPTQSRVIVSHDTGSLPEVQLKGSGKVLDKMIRLKVVNPESLSNVKPGESFDITLQFVPDDEKPADGIQTYIEFDPTKLKVNSVKNSGVLDFTLLENFDNSEGYVSFAAMSWDNPVPTEVFNLVTINFTALEGASDGETTDLIFDSEKNYFSSEGEFISMDYDPIPITFVTKESVIAIEPLPFPAFGDVEKETNSEPKTLVIRNKGEADLQLEALPEVEGFKLVHDCSEPIKPDKSCEITITFTPKEAMKYKAPLTIASNASNEVSDVILEGKGIEPKALVLKGRAKWQGHVSEPHPEWKTGLEVTIDGLPYYPPPQEVGNSGEFELPELADGEHCIEVKGLHTLSTFKEITVPLPEGVEFIEFDEPPLTEGDVLNTEEHRNVLHPLRDGRELILMTVGYPEKKVCIKDAEGYNPQGDLNADGCISKADGELLNANFNGYAKEHGYIPQEGIAGKTCPVTKQTKSASRARRRDLRDGHRVGMASFSTTPIPTNLSVGDTFEMTVLVNANASEPVDAVAFYLNFAPDLLQVNALKSFNRFDLVMEEVFSNGLGRIDFVAFRWDKGPIVETTSLVTISFTLLGKGGERTIAFNNSGHPDRTIVVLSNNYKDTLVIDQAEVIVEDGNVGTGTVLGRILDAFTNEPVANARVVIGELEIVSNEFGEYEITGLPAGTHTVTVISEDDHHFQPQTVTIDGEEPVSLDFVSDWDEAFACPIYAIQDHRVSDTQFFIISPSTKAVRDLGPLYKKHDIEGLAIDQATGELYCTSGDKTDKPGYLCKIDRDNGELAYIGPTGFAEVDSLAIRPTDGSLWGWAVGDGLITIDPETGQGTLQVPYDKPFVEDMVWSYDGNSIYATQGRNLWVYDGEILGIACNNLPGAVEGVEMLPSNALMFAFHQDNSARIHVLDIESCQVIMEEAIDTPYKDIEGIAWWFGCMSQ